MSASSFLYISQMEPLQGRSHMSFGPLRWRPERPRSRSRKGNGDKVKASNTKPTRAGGKSPNMFYIQARRTKDIANSPELMDLSADWTSHRKICTTQSSDTSMCFSPVEGQAHASTSKPIMKSKNRMYSVDSGAIMELLCFRRRTRRPSQRPRATWKHETETVLFILQPTRKFTSGSGHSFFR